MRNEGEEKEKVEEQEEKEKVEEKEEKEEEQSFKFALSQRAVGVFSEHC